METSLFRLQKQAFTIMRNFRQPVVNCRQYVSSDRLLYEILLTVSKNTGISVYDIQGKSRKREIVEARQIYSRRAKEKTTNTLREIGALINKDHAGIYHGIKIANTVKEVAQKYNEVFNIKIR